MSDEASLFIRLYLDEDVQKRVAPALRLRGFDATNAHELHHKGLSDEEQLSFSVAERRAIFTYNTSDFLKLHLEWLRLTKEHAGIIVSDQLPMGDVTRRLLNLRDAKIKKHPRTPHGRITQRRKAAKSRNPSRLCAFA